MSEKLTRPPKRHLSRTLRRGVATAALTGLAALSPGIAKAQTGTGGSSPEKSFKPVPNRVLQKRAERTLQSQRTSEAYNGMLLLKNNPDSGGAGGVSYVPEEAGGTAYTDDRVTSKAIIRPLVEFRGNPKDEFGHNDLTNGDYMFASISIDPRTHKPHVHLRKFDQDTMDLVPYGQGDASMIPFAFQSDKLGNLQLSEPMTAPDGGLDANSEPLLDNKGNALPIGLEVSPRG